MSRKSQYTAQQKIKICQDYLSGISSATSLANMNPGLHAGTISRWADKYNEYGEFTFIPKISNSSYSKEFKMAVVKEYIDGVGSLQTLALKYNIPSRETIRKWISMYNSNMELKDYTPKREVYMAEAKRKTTIEERKEIVTYCMEHGHDYKNTADKYDVSYSQVYSWVRKYDAAGEDGLVDKRGRHKSDEEVDELEKLRRENKRLKHQLEERDMTVELLKKVKEFERRRF